MNLVSVYTTFLSFLESGEKVNGEWNQLYWSSTFFLKEESLNKNIVDYIEKLEAEELAWKKSGNVVSEAHIELCFNLLGYRIDKSSEVEVNLRRSNTKES